MNISYEPADIIIHVRNRGIVLREKSLVAFRKKDNKFVVFGTEAEALIGKDTEKIVVMSPLHHGVVADAFWAKRLFASLFVKALGRKPLFRPAVAICLPKNITELEQRTIEEVVVYAGAKEILVTDIPAEEFIREVPIRNPRVYQKYRIIVGITQKEPERYIKERLQDILLYAQQEKISKKRVCTLLQQEVPTFKVRDELRSIGN